jgi:hypothetical protein
VTHWNYLGWCYPYPLEAATQRQQRYVALEVSPEVYTSALIADGKLDAVGSDGPAVDRTLRQAALSQDMVAPIDVQRTPAGQEVAVLVRRDDGHIVGAGVARPASNSS